MHSFRNHPHTRARSTSPRVRSGATATHSRLARQAQRFSMANASPDSPFDTEGSRNVGEAQKSADDNTSLQGFAVCPRAGLAYDSRMLFHYDVSSRTPHPESGDRVSRILATLQNQDLTRRFLRIPVKEVSDELLLAVHSQKYIDDIESTRTLNIAQLAAESGRYDSLYFNSYTATCARLSAGGVVELCRAVMQGIVNNGIAVVRPPGHHAEPKTPMGFCIYSNVAVAAQFLLRNYALSRILVVDFDVHHGNGTQSAFYGSPNVLYMSIHRFDGGHYYPSGNAGSHTMAGEGDGEGYNVNIPWNGKGVGDFDYMHAFHRIILPIAHEYNPTFVIVSAGFDAAIGDAIGECSVTPAGFAQMTHALLSLAGGRIIMALEGGYHIESVAQSVCACARIILGECPVPLTPSFGARCAPSSMAIETIQKVTEVHSKYWKCLAPRYEVDMLPRSTDDASWRVQLGDIQRAHRLMLLQSLGMEEVKSTQLGNHEIYGIGNMHGLQGSDGVLVDNIMDHVQATICMSKNPSYDPWDGTVFIGISHAPYMYAILNSGTNYIKTNKSFASELMAPIYEEFLLQRPNSKVLDLCFWEKELKRTERKYKILQLLISVWDKLIAPKVKKVVILCIGNSCTSILEFVRDHAHARHLSSTLAQVILAPFPRTPVNLPGTYPSWWFERSITLVPTNMPRFTRVKPTFDTNCSGTFISLGKSSELRDQQLRSSDLWMLDLLSSRSVHSWIIHTFKQTFRKLRFTPVQIQSLHSSGISDSSNNLKQEELVRQQPLMAASSYPPLDCVEFHFDNFPNYSSGNHSYTYSPPFDDYANVVLNRSDRRHDDRAHSSLPAATATIVIREPAGDTQQLDPSDNLVNQSVYPTVSSITEAADVAASEWSHAMVHSQDSGVAASVIDGDDK